MKATHVLAIAAAASMIISVVALSIALERFEVRPAIDYADTAPLSPDAIYLGAATLIGLATFGSLIGARIVTGSASKKEERGIRFMVGGATAVIMTQGFAMTYACCWDVNSMVLYALVWITIVSSAVTILGFSQIMEVLLRFHSKARDEG